MPLCTTRSRQNMNRRILKHISTMRFNSLPDANEQPQPEDPHVDTQNKRSTYGRQAIRKEGLKRVRIFRSKTNRRGESVMLFVEFVQGRESMKHSVRPVKAKVVEIPHERNLPCQCAPTRQRSMYGHSLIGKHRIQQIQLQRIEDRVTDER